MNRKASTALCIASIVSSFLWIPIDILVKHKRTGGKEPDGTVCVWRFSPVVAFLRGNCVLADLRTGLRHHREIPG